MDRRAGWFLEKLFPYSVKAWAQLLVDRDKFKASGPPLPCGVSTRNDTSRSGEKSRKEPGGGNCGLIPHEKHGETDLIDFCEGIPDAEAP